MLTNWLKTNASNASAIKAATRRKHEREEQEEKDGAFEDQLKQAQKMLRKEAAKPAPTPEFEARFAEALQMLEEDPQLKRSDGEELMESIFKAVIPQFVERAFALEHSEASVWDCGGEQGRCGLFHGENAVWCDCEVKCGVVAASAEPKKRKVADSVHLDRSYSWPKDRAPIIFMILHPQVWGKLPRAEACQKGANRLGLELSTVMGWFTKVKP